MGSSDLDGLNKMASRTAGQGQTAGQGLKTKQRDNKQNKWQSKTNEARDARLLGA